MPGYFFAIFSIVRVLNSRQLAAVEQDPQPYSP